MEASRSGMRFESATGKAHAAPGFALHGLTDFRILNRMPERSLTFGFRSSPINCQGTDHDNVQRMWSASPAPCSVPGLRNTRDGAMYPKPLTFNKRLLARSRVSDTAVQTEYLPSEQPVLKRNLVQSRAPNRQQRECKLTLVFCARLLRTATGICEDSRASAGIDPDRDRADRAARKRLPMSVKIFWSEHVAVRRCIDHWPKGNSLPGTSAVGRCRAVTASLKKHRKPYLLRCSIFYGLICCR